MKTQSLFRQNNHYKENISTIGAKKSIIVILKSIKILMLNDILSKTIEWHFLNSLVLFF